MIQRIQSIYYFLAFVLSGFLFIKPFVLFSTDAGVFEVFACHLIGPEDHNISLKLEPLAASAILAGLLSLIAIFLYKNRKAQLRVGRLSIFAFIVTIGLQGAFYSIMMNMVSSQGQPGFSAIIGLVSIVFVLLANRGVKKDEALIRSADRIR